MKAFALRVLGRLKLLRGLNVNTSSVVNGRRLVIPLLGGVGLENLNLHRSEPFMLPLLERLLPGRDGVFLDVGANVGQTLLRVKTVCPEMAYFGFEPSPACVAYLHRLLAANRFAECTVFPVGLSDRSGMATLLSNADTDSAGSVVEGFRESGFYRLRQQAVLAEGDRFIEELGIGAVSVLKIDVEGGELEVIRGLARSLKRFRPVILCEFLPVYSESTDQGAFRKVRQDEALGILSRNGYRMFRAGPTGQLLALDSIETHSDLSACNYVFVHEDSSLLARVQEMVR